MLKRPITIKKNLSLSDGDLSSQIKNVYLSNDAINLAKEIGCYKFLYIGSILENYIDKFIAYDWYESEYNFENQLDYSLAKNICRDFNKLVSYLKKIDYIHCTFSIFIDPELSGKGYIPTTLKQISRGLKYNKPNNNQLFDITLIDEGCEAIYLLSQKAKINKPYFIGTSLPKNLNEIFQTFEKAKHKMSLNLEDLEDFENLEDLDNLSNNDLFNIDNLIKDIGYKPTKTFNEFAIDYFKK